MTVVISGTSGYIADFSNATVASRQAFQTSTTNGSTGIYALPNGTSTAASWQATNAADPTNASKILIATNGSTDVQLVSGINGTGTYLPLTFYTNGAEKMRLDTSGNLGLGVTPSAWSSSFRYIDVNSGASAAFGSTGTTADVANNAFTDGVWKYKTTAAATLYRQLTGQHQWYNAPSGTAGNAITFTQAMTLDASGNLGVGTTSPAHQLDVSNGARAKYLQVTNNGYSGSAATTPELYSPASGTLAFACNGGERARIDSSGNLLVGTTSTVSSSKTTIDYSGGGRGLAIVGPSGAAGNQSINFWAGGTQVGSVSITTTTTSYNTSSDYRLKNTVAPMTGALAKVAALKPCTYKWNTDGSDGEGFIAHELAEVCPQAVTGEKDAVDADGNPQYQGIDTSFLVATLTAAIQEQQQIITQLQADVAALKEKA